MSGEEGPRPLPQIEEMVVAELRYLACLVRAGETWEVVIRLSPNAPPAKRVHMEYAARRRA